MYVGRKCLDRSIQDVVFVIDVSNNIDSSHFQLIRECTANITAELIHNSPRSSVGVILFESNAHIQFSLQTYTSPSSLLSAINNLPYSGGSSTDTDEALTLLLSTAKNGVLGLRRDSSKVAIVITGGDLYHQHLTSSAAAELHASNIFDIITVGFDGANLTELQEIASSPEFVFFANSFDDIHLKQLQNKILLQLCNCKLSMDEFKYLAT